MPHVCRHLAIDVVRALRTGWSSRPRSPGATRAGWLALLMLAGCVRVELVTVGVDRRIGAATSVEIVGPIGDYRARCAEGSLAAEPSTPGAIDQRCVDRGAH